MLSFSAKPSFCVYSGFVPDSWISCDYCLKSSYPALLYVCFRFLLPFLYFFGFFAFCVEGLLFAALGGVIINIRNFLRLLYGLHCLYYTIKMEIFKYKKQSIFHCLRGHLAVRRLIFREFDTSNTLNISLTRMVSGFFCQILDFYITSYYVLWYN